MPVLQERGLMWKDYDVPGGTFRENLHHRPGQPLLADHHPGAQFRYDKLKVSAEVDARGDITINKVPVTEDVSVK